MRREEPDVKTHEFLAKVRDRGNYDDQREAERVTHAVLSLLGQRLAGGEHEHLAAQLPQELKKPLLDSPRDGAGFGVEEFLARTAEKLGTTPEVATWDASAVLTTVAEAVPGGQINHVLTQLQPAYAALFGKPDLA
jgi:uncharacterized protein (DUF2267 family)